MEMPKLTDTSLVIERNIYNAPAEKALLAAAMIAPDETLDKIKKIVTSKDFIHKPHRVIYDAIVTLRANELVSDYVTISSYIRGQRGNYGEFTGALDSLCLNLTPSSHASLQYAEIVRSMSIRLSVSSALLSAIETCVQSPDDVATTLDHVRSNIEAAERALAKAKAEVAKATKNVSGTTRYGW
jgi:replicative DNA helicase